MVDVLTPELRPLFVLAPGAGAGSTSDWMRAWRERLTTIGPVETLDYPYRLAGRKAPDKLPVLIAAHRQALAAARDRHARAIPVVLVGKSMGGRVGCHVALEEAVDALVCLGYPLRSPSGSVRDEVLLALRTPILFVQGTRDPLCPLDDLGAVRARMKAPNELSIVEGGNHSLEVPRGRAGRSSSRKMAGIEEAHPQEASDARVLRTIATFVTSTMTGRVGGSTDAE
jgi:uncharacterized protein